MATTDRSDQLSFDEVVKSHNGESLLAAESEMSTLQINITKQCNLACKHCHVKSGPARNEEMNKDALQACLDIFAADSFTTLDITGGAPELNSHYRWLIEEASRIAANKRDKGLAARVITRTNAAILTQPEFEELPSFWAEHDIEVVVSLPHYEERKTDKMRGEGVFAQIIAGIQAMNAVGYGTVDEYSKTKSGSDLPNNPKSKLTLNIVVNPGGAILPSSQASLEHEYRAELLARFKITFSNLLVITNNPVGRFREFLESRNMLDEYMTKLRNAFNFATVSSAMCRSQISVDVDGKIYDCDFNQIVDMPVLVSCKDEGHPITDTAKSSIAALTIFDLQKGGLNTVNSRRIRTEAHCFACTAGAGSSCGGATA
jgi:radical SAM/Cys-rich protein